MRFPFNWFTRDAMISAEVLTNLRQNRPDAGRRQCKGRRASIATTIRFDSFRSSGR